MGDLNQQVILVTGATSHIGASIADLLAKNGATVVVSGRNEIDGQAKVKKIKSQGGEAIFVAGDMFVPESVKEAVDQVVGRFGRIDSLVISGAGASRDTLPFRFFHEMSADDIESYIKAHWLTRVYAIKAVLPAMKESGGGRIVVLGSDAGRVATAGDSMIGGANAGMMQMCRSLAREFGRDNININTVSMSYIFDAAPRSGGASVEQSAVGSHLLEGLKKRMLFDVTSNDIAQAVMFFLGPGGAAITGQTLSVNGGLTTPG